MSLPPPQTQEFVDRLTSLAIECREELGRSTQSIQEINLLLRQTQQEIGRLNQREGQQSAKLREMEMSLESFSRTEIKDMYIGTHDVQMRLFMMRSQIEQLESRRDSITQQQERLRLLLDLAEINRDHSENDQSGEDRTRILPGTKLFEDSGDLAAEIIATRERERERMSRQLMDGPAQVLANVLLRTQILERVAERAPDRLESEIDDLEKLAADSLLDVRRAIFEMRPLVINELGLVATLRRYVSDFARENGATITVDGPDSDGNLAEYTRITLFRLIQQAMLAMVAPGVGTKLRISVQYEDAQLLFRLEGSPIGPEVPLRVAEFAADAYTTDTLDLVGATLQHESLNESGQRLSIVVPTASE